MRIIGDSYECAHSASILFSQVSVDRLYTHQVAMSQLWGKLGPYSITVLYSPMRQNWCRIRRVALLYVAHTFKQVGNSKIGYFWLLAYSTNCIKPTFAPPILRPLACCARGQLPPSAPGRYATGTNWRFSTNKPPCLRNGARYDIGYY